MSYNLRALVVLGLYVWGAHAALSFVRKEERSLRLIHECHVRF